jgi:hypothetical protein
VELAYYARSLERLQRDARMPLVPPFFERSIDQPNSYFGFRRQHLLGGRDGQPSPDNRIPKLQVLKDPDPF